MGLFRTSDGVIGRAMPLTAALVGAPNALPAWVFENQTGTLGTYLNSSVLYVGVSGDVSVILPGTSLSSVSTLSLLSGGTGDTNGAQTNLATTCPNILFPYAREAISDLIVKAGFSSVLLNPINFEALYMQKKEEEAAKKAGNAN